MRLAALLLVTACTTPMPDADPDALGVVVGPAYVGLPTTFTVTGLAPGTSARLALAPGPRSGACEEGPSGTCWDLVTPIESAERPAADGVATLEVDLPPGTAGTLYVQAASGTRLSPVVPFSVVGPRVDTDGDGVPDAVEHLLGMDLHHEDSDRDGVPDGLDLAPTTPDAPDPFEVRDVQVTGPDVGIVDPEFSADGHMVWQTAGGEEAWIGQVDPLTGAFVPPDGRGVFLADDLPPMRKYKNGPEWLEASDGLHAVFARTHPKGGDVLFQAVPDGDDWTMWPLQEVVFGGGVFGTIDVGDARPRIAWLTGRGFAGGTVKWRDFEGVGTGAVMPVGVAFGHFMRNAHAYVGPITDEAGVTQAGIYHLDDDRLETVTDTPWEVTDAYGWVDPDGTRRCALFRRPPVGADHLEVWVHRPGGWQTEHTIPVPQGYPEGYSVEPFVWEGRTWLTYMTSTRASPADGLVWIASTDPDDPVVRRVSSLDAATRRDPEAVTHGREAWIFYSRLDGFDRAMHRVALGLPPRSSAP